MTAKLRVTDVDMVKIAVSAQQAEEIRSQFEVFDHPQSTQEFVFDARIYDDDSIDSIASVIKVPAEEFTDQMILFVVDEA